MSIRTDHGRRALAGIVLLPLLLAACGTSGSSTAPAGGAPAPSAAAGGGGGSGGSVQVRPPTATPLAQAPAKPEGDGTSVTLQTAKGDITIALYTKSAPVAAQNFENLAGAGFYDGTVFHRIVPGFVIQGGDPTGTGTGGPGYAFPDEPFAGDYTRGTVAMANSGPNTNGSQFFIVLQDSPQLPKNYTIFGTVTSGMEVVDAIAAGPRGGANGDTALQPVEIVRATVHQP